MLIGTIYSHWRVWRRASEFTILRTGGLGPGRALGLLAALGLGFSVVTFVVGDYVAPASERMAVELKARFSGGMKVGGAGAWIKERRSTPQGERSYSINLAGTTADGALQGIRIFEFDAQGRMLSRLVARSGQIAEDGIWTLADTDLARWPSPSETTEAAVLETRAEALRWPSTLSPAVVAAAVLPVATMTTLELWRYSTHLSDQAQASQSHQIRFWKKALYPFACIVMMALALPFAYLHARAGSVSLKVFGGIMLGISFVLLNNLAGHVGQLRDWTPWVAAATPSLFYLLMSLAAFAWLVRYR